jgi:hypothetical protein
MSREKKDQHQKGVRKKRKVDVCCGTCLNFWDIPTEHRSGKQGEFRCCPIMKKDVTIYDQSCDDFELSKLFWCETHSFQCSADICICRINKLFEGCGRCQLGLQLYLYFNPPKIELNFID